MSWRSITGVVMVLLLTTVFSCAAVCSLDAGHVCCAPQIEPCAHHGGHHLHGACVSAPSMVYLCSHRDEAARVAASQQAVAANLSLPGAFSALSVPPSPEAPFHTALFRSRSSLKLSQIPLRI